MFHKYSMLEVGTSWGKIKLVRVEMRKVNLYPDEPLWTVTEIVPIYHFLCDCGRTFAVKKRNFPGRHHCYACIACTEEERQRRKRLRPARVQHAQLSVRIPKAAVEALKEYARVHKMSQSKVVYEAIGRFCGVTVESKGRSKIVPTRHDWEYTVGDES